MVQYTISVILNRSVKIRIQGAKNGLAKIDSIIEESYGILTDA